jgi:predicted amidohydrolase
LGDKTANALRLREAAGAALDGGADLLVVPELQLSGYALAASSADATATVEEVAETLSGTRLAVLAGFHERAGDSTYNSAGYFDDGVPVHVHRKLYLCDYAPFDEHALFAPGDSLRAFDTPFGRMATLVCNDAWQPFLPALAVHDGAEILLFPAASSTVVPGVERDWRDLTRFYARMLECYVVFANRVGSEAGFTFWGGSHIVDPAGEIVAEAPVGEEALVEAEIDVGLVSARRLELPLVGALRPELLRVELERLSAVRA